MKINRIVASVVASVVLAAGLSTAVAQNCPNPNRKGSGYGGPPQSQEEKAARQAACLEKNSGVCPKTGGAASAGACKGQGQGRGNGNCARKGLRDGTGPRAASGTCPLNSPKAGQ